MKKIILVCIAIALNCVTINAVQLSTSQKKAKTEIYSALKKYCTNIIDNDEKLTFQYEGNKYVVNINSLNPKVLYLCMEISFNLPEDYNPEIANRAAIKAANQKPICATAYDDILLFSCEMYTRDVKSFVSVIPDMLQALSSASEKFQDEYDKIAKTYSSSQSSAKINSINNSEFIYPKFGSNEDSRLYIQKVLLESDTTILDMVSYNQKKYQWCNISKNSYISVNGKKFKIQRAEGIEFSPKYTYFPDYDSGREVSLHFKLYFPALPKDVTNFDFSEGEGKGWQIKNVELKHGTLFAVNSKEIETDYHKWKCVSIEIQDGQTILTKTVTPKSKNTHMFSSQKEYIEDADTGRKYYLQNSSIGFEGSPEISHDTNTITFYEVYPALPSTVTSINISSGSQYYVKEIKIR